MEILDSDQPVPNNDSRRAKLILLSKVLGGASVLAVAGLALKRFSRPSDVRWLDYVHDLHHPASSHFRVVNGVRIHYQEKSYATGGDAMILIHGFCASNYTWKDSLDPLAKGGFRVIAPDLKGYGFSEKPKDSRYSVVDQAELIIGLMDGLKLDNAVLVGSTYGGAVALACALKYPERIKKLVLINSVHNNRAVSSRPLKFLYNTALAELAAPALLGSRLAIGFYIKNNYYDKSVYTKDRLAAYCRPLLSAACQSAAINTLRQWDISWMEDRLSSIKPPTRIIWGEKDLTLPIEWGADLHLAIPNSEFIVVPNCGHVPQEERPQETAELILDFCRRRRLEDADNIRRIKR